MEQQIRFYKYQGTGNDFVVIDNRSLTFPKSPVVVKNLCDRRFGIGADGLILLEEDPDHRDAAFKMVYYNSDGNESTMCGNGGRCIVAFADFLKIFKQKVTFTAIDGLHEAEIADEQVKLRMCDVSEIQEFDGYSVIDTGSPHYLKFVENAVEIDVYSEGKKIRNSEPFALYGINVNFVEKISDDSLFVRTYERGVEDETLSCGTGATASALQFFSQTGKNSIEIKVPGGNLKVHAEAAGQGFKNVWLEGPAVQVFEGTLTL